MVSQKIKSLLPTLREKKRYISFKVISKESIRDGHKVNQAIMQGLHSFLGELGLAKAGIIILADKFNPECQCGMIRTGHRHVNDVKAALCFVQSIENNPVIIRSLGMSGMIHKAEGFYKW